MPAVRGPEEPAATAVLVLMAALATLGALVWLGAALGALVVSGTLLGVGVPEAMRAVLRLPRHLADPALAWPPATRAVLPGPLGYWAAQAAAVAVVIAAGLCGCRLWRVLGEGRHPLGVRPEAGIARPSELRRLTVAAPMPGRLTLGRAGRRLLAAEADASLAVVGPTGCGKTAGLAIPALLEWKGPVLATSVKADLVDAAFAHRERQGHVWVYDPTAASGVDSASWSPLSICGSWAGAQRMAAWLCEAAAARRDSVSDADYWYAQARKGLAPYLLAAALDGAPMAQVVRWVDGQEADAVRQAFAAATARERCGWDAVIDALGAAEALWAKEERVRSSVFSTMENVLAGYADPGVAALAASKERLVDFGAWLSGDNTIFVVAAAHEQARLRPVLTVVVQQAIRAAYDAAAARRGGRLEHSCLLLLDEAGNTAPLPDLPGYASTARSHGITLVSVWQDLAQVEALYGRRSQTVLNNHRAKLFGTGIADGPTLEYLSRLVGEEARTEANRSIDLAGGRRSVSEHRTYRRAAPVDVLRRIRVDEAVLVYGSELPAHLRLRPWYADPVLGRLGGGRAEAEAG